MAALRAKLLQPNQSGLAHAGKVLREGGLVAFPTETVYGLGANALSERAVLQIFKAKKRPLTDPLIVHVTDTERALALLEIGGWSRRVFAYLANRFWPGPLTMVARASDAVPGAITAGTGFVGVRCPSHGLAQKLLEQAQVPVAAPSANRFGHVSPTSAHHVLADLGAEDICVLDGGGFEGGCCAVGIESTVLQVGLPDNGATKEELVLFRRGGVSEDALRVALREGGFGEVVIRTPQQAVPHTEDDGGIDTTGSDAPDPTAPAQVAPGQLLKHYAPDVETRLVLGGSKLAAATVPGVNTGAAFATPLESCVVVDFHGSLAWARGQVLAYRELSNTGDVREAAAGLFDALRWSEGVRGVGCVLLPDLCAVRDEHAAAVADRLFRAASGRFVGESQLRAALMGGAGGDAAAGAAGTTT